MRQQRTSSRRSMIESTLSSPPLSITGGEKAARRKGEGERDTKHTYTTKKTRPWPDKVSVSKEDDCQTLPSTSTPNALHTTDKITEPRVQDGNQTQQLNQAGSIHVLGRPRHTTGHRKRKSPTYRLDEDAGSMLVHDLGHPEHRQLGVGPKWKLQQVPQDENAATQGDTDNASRCRRPSRSGTVMGKENRGNEDGKRRSARLDHSELAQPDRGHQGRT